MTTTPTEPIPFDEARPGDWVESPSPDGGPPRRALIVEVRGDPGHRRFLVRWDEEHESVHYPGPRERLYRSRTAT
ncbi:DUF1918 domain-containing protein [Patulibacter defluvii]|uniref:DUF1918 domain-containing protein n=1 Tax=Patulibacter defluvii TaxID=3095358 RepID=UPI002A7478B4|nr:DUF1918 domain-containing protein [Patulibacter sp. DM4]